MIGKAVSHYKVTDKLGAGGMGEVYLAEDTRLDRTVALKFLPSSMWNEAEAQQRLIREAKSASKLDHPNIVTIYGIDEYEGRPFIVMAYVRGLTMDAYCAAQRPATDELIELFLQIADGLQHAHESGIIHRDLKPGNILIDDRGRPRILDFGIARMRGTTRLTQAGSTIGTLAYSPPELAQGKDAEVPSDIFSLGVVMYQMLTGRLPFEGEHEAALIDSIVHEPPLPFRESGTLVPMRLQGAILRCLEKQPTKRFPNCAALINELRSCKSGHVSSGPAEGAPAKPSIAVLPFANMSADPENEYFSDGLSEELMNVLARNPGLRVTGRTSSFSFKGKQEDLREIGLKLGVETLLEGSVRKAGNRVRITAQLVKALDGFHLWTETYDRVLDDIFVVQDDIAKSVSEAMNVALLGKATPRTHVNAESFNLLMQANHFLSLTTQDSMERAKALFEDALAIDSNDARAWAGLGRVLLLQAGYGFADNDLGAQSAKAAGQKAVAIDDSLPEAHLLMGSVSLRYDFDWKKAGESYRRAYQLAPSDGRVVVGLSGYESYCGDIRRSVELATESIKLDPLNPFTFMAVARVFLAAGDTQAAREQFQRALQLSPGIPSAHASISGTLALEGRPQEALEEAGKESPSGYRSTALAIVYHLLGRTQESDESLKSLLADGEQWGFQIACVHAIRGERDDAFAWLDRSYELHDSGLATTGVQRALANLYDDPRWPAFLKKIGLDRR